MSDASPWEIANWTLTAFHAIHGSWEQADPFVVALPGEREPVVADVAAPGDDACLHVLHSGLVYAAEITKREVVEHLEENATKHGVNAVPCGPRPAVACLSEFSQRFERQDFEDLHPEQGGGRDE